MSFKRYVCWMPERVDVVMETEALQPSPALFAATHQPLKMYRQRQWNGADEPYDERSFLKDFLEPASYVFVPVLGDAGTGKSHLIRWLEANIPATDSRRVLLIPKIGTNMREVLLRILNMPGVEGPRFQGFRERVLASSGHLTAEMAKELLLDNLAVVIGPNGPHHLAGASRTVIDQVPALLRDHFFRPHLLKPGGVIDGLVCQAIGSGSHQQHDRRRQFSAEDLPLQLAHAREAGQQARSIWTKICMTPQLRDETIAWLNKWIDEAVSRVFNLGGRDLANVMIDVREELRARGIELIVLIEDFALLQGIDMQLLEALLVRPQQGDRHLCSLRVAMACTSGYFAPLFDTVQTRAAFYVNMDLTVSGGMVREAHALGLAARYLNAARLNEATLTDWHEGQQGDAELDRDLPPSACDGCAHRTVCHSAFGAADGFGLYPFNAIALIEMMRRTTGDKFNPRALIRRVLYETLQRYTKELKDGRFPSQGLHVAFNNAYREAFGPGVRQDIKQRDSVNAGRRFVLLDLWSTTDKPVNLDPGIHEAFDIAPINGWQTWGEAYSTMTEGHSSVPEVSSPIAIPVVFPNPLPSAEPALHERATQLTKAINDWSTGARKLIRAEFDELRELIFEAVKDRIDWDAELLVKSRLVGASASLPFQPRRSINFTDGMQGVMAQAPVQLNLPLEGEDRLEVAAALQAMVHRKYRGNWRYQTGPKDLRRHARAVDRWSAHVIAQLRRPLREEPNFEPVAAAVEVLAIGQRLLGRPVGVAPPLTSQLNALFAPLPDPDMAPRVKPWADLAAFVRDKLDALKNLVLYRTACTKGGSDRVQFVDVARILDPLAAVRKDWVPQQPVPETCAAPTSPFKPIADVRRKLDELLDLAIAGERSRHEDWLTKMREHLGDTFDLQSATAAAVAAARAAADAGVLLGSSAEELSALRNELPYAKFAETVEIVKAIVEMDPTDRPALLAAISKPLHAVMDRASRVVDAVDEMLGKSTEKVKGKLEESRAGTVDLQQAFSDIQAQFQRLGEVLSELEGSNA